MKYLAALIKKILTWTGINRAVFYFLVGKGFSFAATPVTLFLIATYFSPSEQGYYYTFSSLMGLSIFFELGLGVVITQFASHEYVNLKWTESGSLEGDVASLSRFISLLRKSLKWYAVITSLFIAVVIPVGLKFFGSKPESVTVNYILPWIMLILFFGLNTTFIPLFSILEGCGKVAHVQQLRVIQVVSGVLCSWTIIVLKGKLFAPSVEFVAYWFVILGWLIYNYKGLILQLLHYESDPNYCISWSKEVFPMQWRVAVSWISAYFMNYLFIPILFAYKGSVEAGKMGMSMKFSSLVFLLSMAWINTRVPYYGALIKQKKYKELDALALRSTLQAVFVGVLFSAAIVAGIMIINKYTGKYVNRILPEYIIGILCFASIVSVINTSIAGYLRAHKQEPLMAINIILAVVIALSTFITGKYSNANIMVIAYTLVQIFIALPTFAYIFIKKRKEWHET